MSKPVELLCAGLLMHDGFRRVLTFCDAETPFRHWVYDWSTPRKLRPWSTELLSASINRALSGSAPLFPEVA